MEGAQSLDQGEGRKEGGGCGGHEMRSSGPLSDDSLVSQGQ